MENKKTKTNNSAFPIIAEDYIIDGGLTKREYFAAMALQGALANKSAHERTIEMITESVVRIADALIEELNKTKQDEK